MEDGAGGGGDRKRKKQDKHYRLRGLQRAGRLRVPAALALGAESRRGGRGPAEGRRVAASLELLRALQLIAI